MWLQRSPPICRGLSFPVGSTKSAENWDRALSAEKIFSMDDVIDEISREKHSAGDKVSPSKALSKEFPLEPRELYEITYLAFGISLYIDKWVPNGPFGRPIMGFAAHAVHTNPNAAFTKGLIAKKQREVEQAREAKRHKQLERDDDPSNTDDGATLVEKDPFSGLKKPSLPTRFPSDMSLNQFLEEAADKSKQLIGSVCDFWSRRVEGLMENYVDSSRRILHQMPKVLISFPHDASMTIRRMSTHFGTVFEDVRRDVRDTWNEEMQERKLKEEREKNETKQHESKRGPSGKV